MAINKLVVEGYEIPRWYGFSHIIYGCSYPVAKCYPIPLNLIVRYVRALWLWIKFPNVDGNIYFRDAYNQGCEAGKCLISIKKNN